MKKNVNCTVCPFKNKCLLRQSSQDLKNKCCNSVRIGYEKEAMKEASIKRRIEILALWEDEENREKNLQRFGFLLLEETKAVAKFHSIPEEKVVKFSPDVYNDMVKRSYLN